MDVLQSQLLQLAVVVGVAGKIGQGGFLCPLVVGRPLHLDPDGFAGGVRIDVVQVISGGLTRVAVQQFFNDDMCPVHGLTTFSHELNVVKGGEQTDVVSAWHSNQRMKRNYAALSVLLLLVTAPLLASTVLTNRQVTVVWDPNPEGESITNYTVYAASASNGVFSAVAQVNGATTNATLTGLAAGERWYYLTAKNFWGLESEPSVKVNTPATASKVEGLSVVRIPTGIQLNWSGNPTAEEIKNYRVYSGSNVADVGSFTVISSPTNTVHQEAMAPGFRAFFVTASNFWGEGFPSEIVTVPAPASAPGKPQLSAD